MLKPAIKFAAILCLGMGTLSASAQLAGMRPAFQAGPGMHMHSSMSGQFVVRDADGPGGRPVQLNKDTEAHYVRVDSTLLTVSCERIKHALLTEMDAPDNWRDRIYIDLRHARTLNDTVIISSEPFGRDWNYHVSLPDTVERTRLVTSMVDVLLLEMANRKAGRSAEIPTWLGFGLCEDILRSSDIELVLKPARPVGAGMTFSSLMISGTKTNALAIAHADLRAAPPLTLDQLSWPDETRLDGAEGETYRSSAQLLVHDLLELRDGHAAMRAFIQELPEHLNWQLSFLHAFRADFGSQLDLEKWWALRLVDFTGRDIFETWSPEVSWDKLEEIIRPVVEVRTRVNELPLRSEVKLQTIIEKWDVPRQVETLKERSKLLYSLRSRVSQEFAKLVDDYRRTIDVYLEKRREAGYLRTPLTREVMGLDEVERQTIADLNVLDSIREDLRPKPQILQSAEVKQDANH